MRYFKEHLSFLLEGGKAIAKALPRTASALASSGMDPDVERLLEGIAFISGKISEKQDQSLAQICQLISDLLFPHYLSPVPPTAIVELKGEPCLIPRGTEIQTAPVSGTRCRFRTVFETQIPPFNLEHVQWQQRHAGAQLYLELVTEAAKDQLAEVPLLQLHLHGEPLLTRTLFYWLMTRLESVELINEGGETIATQRAPRLRARGYRDEESLFMYPHGSFSGFRLLQEYFTLPQKFLFVELEQLSALLRELPPSEPGTPLHFGLRFNLAIDSPLSFMVTPQNIRLGCTPIVNLFPHTGDPIQRHPWRSEFKVRPAGSQSHYDIYRILEVSGFSKEGITPYPLLSELDPQSKTGVFCQILRQYRPGQSHLYLTINDGHGECPPRQILMTDLLCTNGELSSAIRGGDVMEPDAPFASHTCRLLSSITRSISHPGGEEMRLRLVKHILLTQIELCSHAGFKGAIELYNFHALVDQQRAKGLSLLLSGLMKVDNEMIQTKYRGIPIWGRSTKLTLDESIFDTESEIFLLGNVLNEFVAFQAPINHFSEFSIHCSRSQETIRWSKRLGSQQL